MEAEAKVAKVSADMLAEVATKLGKITMYREVLQLAVAWRDKLPQAFLDELVDMDPQHAKTKSSNPL